MRILFVNPSQRTVYGKPIPQVYPPLGLLYIGAVLERDDPSHKIRLIDIDAEKMGEDKLVRYLKSNKPDLVGITCTTSVYNSALDFAKLFKSFYPDVPVVLGGIHPTTSPRECIESPYVDCVVIGEGEVTTRELVGALENGVRDLSKIDGLAYKIDGKITYTNKRKLIDNLDEIPFPARHLLKKPNAYVPADARRRPVTSIITTRGCHGACTYCCTKQIFGRKLRLRSIDNILNEMDYCIRNYGVKEFHIADDNFVFDKDMTLEFCKEIRKRKYDLGFVFFNGLRADNVDREILEALKGIGVLSVGYGVESGNEQVLRNIKKGIRLDTFRKAFKLSKGLGFQTWAFFIVGLPGDTNETVRDTINFAKELDPDFAKFLILKPFPGSEVYSQLDEKGLIFDHNYDHYGVYTDPVHSLPDLNPEHILKWQKRAFREFYLRPKKIAQHILRIRSFTQLVFDIRSVFFVLFRSK